MLKKILFLILIPIIAFTTCCTNVDGKSGSEDVIQNVNHRTKELSLSSDAISKGYDDGYSEPVTGEYKILENAKTADANLIDEHINGEDFGFQNEYVDDLNRKAVITDSGFSFTTQRIRCGYINNQYLALSAKCKDAGTAYLQLDFTQDIQSFDFGIAIWSDEEYLNQKSSIILETKGKDGVYKTKYIFNIAEMSKNKGILDNYSFSFNEETYGIRIKVTTNQVNYEKNKGRVVLSDFGVRHS